ncbi:alpha/beta fold hydrolase [Gloeobacter kilaueensis]|uniref:Alpha/beta hydrolase fold protein n=1 Tax=Gloeobacter kilaueensis (strain ATCC BAA-2537 / CCAP 1431/1 / ULC 316 / JS1) TaxID=1183438 RepID=U5QIU8_GLOK1|nr:alpha/beta fold hydrolase [Gloeobacter kilaueensis]AGY58897.1 alpha/beta hydrolase fold protein [Gloeobacter kilaueensis JS1]
MPIDELTISAGPGQWSYLQVGSTSSSKPPVLLLHGLPSYSYGWRDLLPFLAEAGFQALAIDWIGFGKSDKPEKKAFAYTPVAFLGALTALVAALKWQRFSLVVQGFLGSVGIQYAQRHPEQIERLAILNAPVATGARLPWNLKQLGLPLVGEMLTQNPLSVDQTLEGGGYWAIPNGDLGMFRRPYSLSGDAGRSLMLTVRNLQLEAALSEIEAGFAPWRSPETPPFPVGLIWGMRDRYLKDALIQSFRASHPQIGFYPIQEAGHYPLEQEPEAVSKAVVRFLSE